MSITCAARRFEVPVFKYPEEPFSRKQQAAMNYIKRLAGLENETIGIFSGDLYRTTALTYPDRPRPMNEDGTLNELDLWRYEWMYPSDREAIAAFKRGEFELIRKEPPQVLAERRMVFDLNHQRKSVEGIARKRWHPTEKDGAGWEMDDAGFHHGGEALGWVTYQHINPENDKVYYITDYLGYNVNPEDGAAESNSPFRVCANGSKGGPEVVCQPPNWVSDLIVECDAEIPSADVEVVLELAKGPDRYQASFKSGQCHLYRVSTKDERVELGSRPTRMTKRGKYHLRLANVDCRLTVWIDGRVLPFSREETDYPPPPASRKFEPTNNDYDRPAQIGSRGEVRCTNVKLWRDIFYSCTDRASPPEEKHPLLPEPHLMPRCSDEYVQTFYVQPGHYLRAGRQQQFQRR